MEIPLVASLKLMVKLFCRTAYVSSANFELSQLERISEAELVA